MVSFDIESLFTNVPIEGAVQAALQKMENDAGLADRTTLTPVQIADLLGTVHFLRGRGAGGVWEARFENRMTPPQLINFLTCPPL